MTDKRNSIYEMLSSDIEAIGKIPCDGTHVEFDYNSTYEPAVTFTIKGCPLGYMSLLLEQKKDS